MIGVCVIARPDPRAFRRFDPGAPVQIIVVLTSLWLYLQFQVAAQASLDCSKRYTWLPPITKINVLKIIIAVALLASLTGCALPPDHDERMQRMWRGLASDLPRIQQEQAERRREAQSRQPIRQAPTQTNCMRIGDSISCSTQ